MLLPIGDTPNPRGRSYVNYCLIALNLAVFGLVTLPLSASLPDLNDPLLLDYLRAIGAQGGVPVQSILDHVSAYDLAVFRYGFRPGDPGLLSLFSAMFLHAGWLHLAGNMLFLYIYGDNVEHRLGRFNYLLVYLGTGIAATLFFALMVPGSQVPLIGASGAISGVLGCYFVWFPRNKIKVFVFLFPFFMNTVLVPARWVLGFYLLIDNLIPLLLNGGGGSGVAHGAHLGGFLAGGALALGVDRLPGLLQSRRNFSFEEEIDADDTPVVPPAEEIARLIANSRPARAAQVYIAITDRAERSRVASSDLLALGDFFQQAADYDRALGLFRRLIAERPRDPAHDRALLGAGRALLHKPRCITSAYHYFLAAIDVTRDSALAEECRLHLRAIERLGQEQKTTPEENRGRD